MRRLGILFVLTFICFSCQDFLNLVPKNQQVIYTQKDVKTAMSSFLLTCGTGTKYNISFNGMRLRFPLMKDVCIAYTIYGDDIDLARYYDFYGEDMAEIYKESVDWKAVNMAERMWTYFYTSIGYLNEMLKNLDSAPGGEADEYQQVAGEARVFRAFYIFKLMQFFAPYHDNNLGIPLNLDANVVEGGERWKQTDVYHTIITELEEVLSYKAPALLNWNVMYDKEIIKAMLAQVYLYKAMSAAGEPSDWSNAEKYSGEIVAGHGLETAEEDLTAQFIPSQVIGWRKDNPYSLLMMVCYNSMSVSSEPFSPWGAEDERLFPNPELVSLYDQNDIRLKTYLGYQKMQGSNQWYIGKYNYYINKNYNYYNECIALFRIADMYLINAEAKVRMGHEEPAKQILQKFKQSRIPGFTTVSGNVLDEILKERRKEFCYEGDARFMDIKRLGLAVTRVGIDPKGDGIRNYSLDTQDYRYTLPVPAQTELGYNKIEQNPGWNIVK